MKLVKGSKKCHLLTIALFFVLFVVSVYGVRYVIPPPSAVENRSSWFELPQANLLLDSSWLGPDGQRVLDQSIFDAVISQIDRASDLVLLDMFLFNDWQGPKPEQHRALSDDLTAALLRARARHSSMPVIVITDPINTLYGGVKSDHLQALSRAGVLVVKTPLIKLQDSNPVYSAIWRAFIRPWGNRAGVQGLKAPFGDERISLRSWLALLNFKANHRKLLVTQTHVNDKGWQAVVSSANPHDGSSAHRNVAIQFSGEAVKALFGFEIQLLQLAADADDGAIREPAIAAMEQLSTLLSESSDTLLSSVNIEQMDQPSAANQAFIRVLTEKAILDAVLAVIDAAKQDDEVNVLMFYLSHRSIVTALKRAAKRGARVKVLLDANKDAFGRIKQGVPNRPVADELTKAGVRIRWCATAGEQCHAKVIHVKTGDLHRLISGSGNYTRRNLDNLNLETNVDIRVRGKVKLIDEFTDYFNTQWQNSGDRIFSEDYDNFADPSFFKKWRYRFMEASGLGTF